MLVFFMLATNFYEKRDIEFSIEKDISENSELKETIVIKIQKNDYFFNAKKIEKKIYLKMNCSKYGITKILKTL